MKLVDLKILKNETLYKRLLNELKLVGLDSLYIKRTEQIDYLDIIVNAIDFLTINKKILKKLTDEQYENMVIIIIDEIFEKIGFETTDEQIEKILKLLKNSLLVQSVYKYIRNKIYKIFTRLNCFSKKD
tara:strand:+ start:332 stop:718 length:387 start_codon:yes stop_codon:yes gene_type:complete